MTQIGDPKNLAARGWFGYGRWTAPYWFVGMEPGGADDDASYEVWVALGGSELVSCRDHHLGANCLKWHSGDRPATQSTWRRLIQLVLGYEGKPADLNAVRLYQRDEWGSLGGDTAVLEVSALHAKSRAMFVDRTIYRNERVATLRERLQEYQPKFIVFYGKEYTSVYEEIVGARFDGTGYAWHCSTLCALVLHPASQNLPPEMRSGDWWIEKGQKMRFLTGDGEGG